MTTSTKKRTFIFYAFFLILFFESFPFFGACQSQSKKEVKNIKDTVENLICWGKLRLPQFPNGEKALFNYLGENIRYPEESVCKGHEGTIFIHFIVEKDGSVANFIIRKSAIFVRDSQVIKGHKRKEMVSTEVAEGDALMENEAIRVLKAMPKWIPGTYNGMLINESYTLPIRFKLENAEWVLNNGDSINKVNVERPIYFMEDMPKFPEGEKSYFAYLRAYLHYPEESFRLKHEGMLFINFLVREDGTLTNLYVRHAHIFTRGSTKIINAYGDEIEKEEPVYCDQLMEDEALRVLKAMPNWIPAKQHGRPVATEYTIPIKYNLHNFYGVPREIQPDSFVNKVVGVQKDSLKPNIYSFTDVTPQFSGGWQAMLKFIADNLSWPPSYGDMDIEGSVFIQFIVKKDGALSDFVVKKPLDKLLDIEAIRVLKLMPKWIPGTKNGVPVDVYYTLPVKFKFE